jgi:hypothetical protein
LALLVKSTFSTKTEEVELSEFSTNTLEVASIFSLLSEEVAIFEETVSSTTTGLMLFGLRSEEGTEGMVGWGFKTHWLSLKI